MERKEFKAESKRLLEMMVNSIYSQKEIFLRELISNASDAIDKIYYRALSDDSITFNKDDYFIKVTANKEDRTLTVSDTGIGMTKEELESNLGTIAKSGSLAFKTENESKDGHDIIGQFGVGFYSAFMVADKVTVTTKALGEESGYQWESTGADGYTILPIAKESVGTEIRLKLKENSEDESYDEFLEEYRLTSIIKKYSDFIRYPIKMDVTKRELKEGTEDEYEDVIEEQTINSMVPIWRKNKNELKDEDYTNFYHEKRYGFDQPLKHIHISVDGAVRYNAILFIPENIPFDYYTKEFEKGLELYSNGVLIMEKCPDLLPDYYSFVKGMVDSEDLSLNISREMLQHDRQLKLIAKNIKNKITSHLKTLLKDEREKFEQFYRSFGRQLKYGVYSDFGANKEDLQDLLLFYSSTEKKMVTLDEYVSRMKEDQPYIYYATGESYARIEKLPQTEMVADKGYEILYFTEDVDEFAIKMLASYKEKEFRSVSSGDLGFEDDEQKDTAADTDEQKELFEHMKTILDGKVKDVRASKRLKSHPVCLTAEGEVSIEMEKVLRAMPDNQNVQAEKVLEINVNHDVFDVLKASFESDKDKVDLYTKLLYNQALLIEGLPVEDPVAFSNDICKVMA
ncbi:molecular chaperone HtpG [Halalkalibacterium halodurans]|uniref:Chaperone protein HtpG n=1 Tax=Halalkalibacterium halodurans (strain ATCC BAA-125 / DSM 18197 / FERM 7344 / JCM 9153 / C-125) TaxID=272558 RepID=HTPG_HALH5|nr:molecular chaperone HtpG [Halalkalibacterium halodurans]Q9KE51.1 RecName: Full=Chaperone protein HtpG; AltName: Full=Heat shock protein HtpG; AltName: Full=High temperature protein G [Halalkalibacterium halodurans C-125]MED4080475.1 molecular chaperone HtpG [Halalkalibacterium halodurans]MED4086512.1 molecular chaperone HtpG [Halalkalibacterium halodurans]MED4104779.1 molecular chaperone HtpG [Halalkalibacterium halodurans]MED4109644.1 molecular chaperone HtpG [Halalkalibacterium halodurans